MEQSARTRLTSLLYAVLLMAGTAMLVLGGLWVYNSYVRSDTQRATVVGVQDGDTVIVDIDGKGTAVDLINVNAPDIATGDQPQQCLANESAQYLAKRLPSGTEVDLVFDHERKNSAGHLQALVQVDDVSINQDIAKEGLATAAGVKENKRFYQKVLDGQNSAMKNKRGLFDPTVPCSLEAQAAEQKKQIDAVQQPGPGVDVPTALEDAAAKRKSAAAFTEQLSGQGLQDLGLHALSSTSTHDYVKAQRDALKSSLRSADVKIDRLKEAKETEEKRRAADKENEKRRSEWEKADQASDGGGADDQP
ncbi:thermonuclease family protein [Helcobacillus massiliensis]|uniref:Micrococcal nuclease n=1 Tax=Helcobacillus massiliensis TaxID=521392 RepID=A0A839QQZ4_9MICO|nr:micrococcal nuclease [Helcobacillus massiliensis]